MQLHPSTVEYSNLDYFSVTAALTGNQNERAMLMGLILYAIVSIVTARLVDILRLTKKKRLKSAVFYQQKTCSSQHQ